MTLMILSELPKGRTLYPSLLCGLLLLGACGNNNHTPVHDANIAPQTQIPKNTPPPLQNTLPPSQEKPLVVTRQKPSAPQQESPPQEETPVVTQWEPPPPQEVSLPPQEEPPPPPPQKETPVVTQREPPPPQEVSLPPQEDPPAPPPDISEPDNPLLRRLEPIAKIGSNPSVLRDARPDASHIASIPNTERTNPTDANLAYANTILTREFLMSRQVLRFQNGKGTEISTGYALLPVKAHYAYARGYTGKNVVAGVLDVGFAASSPPELAGQLYLAPGETDYTNHRLRTISGCIGTSSDDCKTYSIPMKLVGDQHGTEVASVLAGKKGNADGVYENRGTAMNMHGIAYDSKLTLRTIIWDEKRGDERVLPGGNADAAVFTLQIGDMVRDGAQVVNLSITLSNTNARTAILTTARQLDWRYHMIAEAFYAADTDPDPNNKDVLLAALAAGNLSGAQVEAGVAFSLYYPELRDRFVYVAGVDTTKLPLIDNITRDPAVLDEALSNPATQPKIASFSNRCGIAGPWCIVAPAVDLPVAGPYFTNDGYTYSYGTSFATPLVSGALAILIDQFRVSGDHGSHSNKDILARLLQTANKSGIYKPNSIYDPDEVWTLSQACGDTGQPACQFHSVYGMGLLDLDAATRPWGTLSVVYDPPAAGASISSAARSRLGDSHIKFSPAFGDALSQALEDKTAYFFDALDFAFSVPAVSFVPEVQSNRMASRLAAFDRIERHVAGDWYGMGFAAGEANDKAGLYLMPAKMAEGKAGFAGLDSYLSLAQEGQGFAAGWQNEGHSLSFALLTDEEKKDVPGSRVMALAYGYETLKGMGVSLRAGWAEEESALLGARTSGLYGQSEAGNTFFASLGASLPLAKGWHVFADIEAGRTEASQAVSGAYEASALVSANMAAGVWRKNAVVEGDWLGFMASQPLRIEEGDARFSYASGRESNAVVVMTHEEISLTPSGRTLDLQAAYRAPESESGLRWQAAIGMSLAPRHQADARPEAWGLVGIKKTF